jgi:hypothetical protein
MGYVFVILKIPSNAGHNISCGQYVAIMTSISIKDFVREKKSATEKRKSNINFY